VYVASREITPVRQWHTVANQPGGTTTILPGENTLAQPRRCLLDPRGDSSWEKILSIPSQRHLTRGVQFLVVVLLPPLLPLFITTPQGALLALALALALQGAIPRPRAVQSDRGRGKAGLTEGGHAGSVT
jgi:hypothetical protein